MVRVSAFSRSLFAGVLFGVLALPCSAQARLSPTVYDTARFHALRWRNIGPFRGGRVTTVAGVTSQPMVYYMGATGGGVWKTEDAGGSWKPVSDGFLRMGSIGVIAVAEDDPNVVYVGTGEAPVRGVSSSWGDGMYKSTDAGRSWMHVGLAESRQISAVVIHPRNSELVYVAAQGSRYGPSAERGVYRTADGGKSWRQILSVDSITGPSALTMDPSNARVLYAAFWDHQRTPWKVRSGGPKSSIWKSTDGGDTWTKLEGGLPAPMGKIGIAVSPANPERLWANIEADSGGVYRSDNGGVTWQLVNSDRLVRARAWYYTVVVADPANADVVYVLNAPITKSIDGGRTFKELPDPHGDNHALWINPKNPLNMVNGNDGGAEITFNGGVTWSTQNNQPTAQFYRVNTDNRFPYWVYGGQQDNTSVAILSRTLDAGITPSDWHPVGGCESAHVAFDPDDPHYSYAGCYHGIIDEFNDVDRTTRSIMPWPALGLGEPSDRQKYRFNWSAPILTSVFDRHVIYFAGNVLFRSSDRGRSWSVISPDLTRNEKDKQGPGGGPITNEGAGGEVYNTIYYVAESPHEKGTLWVGTDDGLIHLTRDEGKTWSNVTPPGLSPSLINMVEVSPHDPGTAYAAVSRHKWNDNTPHVFKTTDYGKTWTQLVNGIRAGDVVRVVREDPNRKGLLYAGTETGVYISYDGGQHWQSLQLNLPAVPVTDMQVRNQDLVISTEGRAFWILDNVGPLEQLTDSVARAPVTLFKPLPIYRVYGAVGGGTGVGKNPPGGVTLDYYFSQPTDTATVASLEISDMQGKVIRTFTTSKPKAEDAPGGESDPVLPAAVGLNRFVWNLRYPDARRIPKLFSVQSRRGWRIPAGRYQARLSVGRSIVQQTFEVLADPRVKLGGEDAAERERLLLAVGARVDEIQRAAIALRDVREQVTNLLRRTKSLPAGPSVLTQGTALLATIDGLVPRLVSERMSTVQDVINFRHGINDQYLYLVEAIDGNEAPVTQGVKDRFADLESQWAGLAQSLSALLQQDIPAFNAQLKQADVPVILLPAPPELGR